MEESDSDSDSDFDYNNKKNIKDNKQIKIIKSYKINHNNNDNYKNKYNISISGPKNHPIIHIRKKNIDNNENENTNLNNNNNKDDNKYNINTKYNINNKNNINNYINIDKNMYNNNFNNNRYKNNNINLFENNKINRVRGSQIIPEKKIIDIPDDLVLTKVEINTYSYNNKSNSNSSENMGSTVMPSKSCFFHFNKSRKLDNNHDLNSAKNIKIQILNLKNEVKINIFPINLIFFYENIVQENIDLFYRLRLETLGSFFGVQNINILMKIFNIIIRENEPSF